MTNLFENLLPAKPEEQFTTLLATPGVRIERIVSHGHASPPGFWYDQPQAEWVLVLQGQARLEFEQNTRDLQAGDCLLIPAHQKHRVAWTTTDVPTVWLAVHLGEGV